MDPYDSGSHKDMDYGIMMKGIESLRPYFTELAASAMERDTLSAETLKEIGIRGEQMMFTATGGVNTHKGAVFSLGLAVSAVARILCGHSRRSLPEEIAALASRARVCSGHTWPSGTRAKPAARGYGLRPCRISGTFLFMASLL